MSDRLSAGKKAEGGGWHGINEESFSGALLIIFHTMGKKMGASSST